MEYAKGDRVVVDDHHGHRHVGRIASTWQVSGGNRYYDVIESQGNVIYGVTGNSLEKDE